MDKPGTAARIKPSYILSATDIVEPTMSGEDWVDLQRGLDLFHAHKFWESHEAWEAIGADIWNRVGFFFKG